MRKHAASALSIFSSIPAARSEIDIAPLLEIISSSRIEVTKEGGIIIREEMSPDSERAGTLDVGDVITIDKRVWFRADNNEPDPNHQSRVRSV